MRTDIQTLLAKHPGLLHRARFASMRFEIRSSSDRLRVKVDGPRIHASLAPRDSTETSGDPTPDFSVEADAAAWHAFSRPEPPPGYHDVLALIGAGHARFEGNGLPFYTNLFLVKGIVAAIFREDEDLW
ncbi:MAG: hypothetical protein V4787_24585 [Pseudomonadota bacterium]